MIQFSVCSLFPVTRVIAVAQCQQSESTVPVVIFSHLIFPFLFLICFIGQGEIERGQGDSKGETESPEDLLHSL